MRLSKDATERGQVNKVRDKGWNKGSSVSGGCPDNNQSRHTSRQCVVFNYLTISDSWTLRGKVDESSTSRAAPLPDASGLFVWTVWVFWCAATQWSLRSMRTDTVAWPGTIDRGYFYRAVWLEGRDNDCNTCIILNDFSCCPLPHKCRGSEAGLRLSSFSQLFKKKCLHYNGQSVRLKTYM